MYQQTCRTTCPYCGVGCGLLVEQAADGISVRGDPDHPSNYGRLCSKGAALGDTLELDDRILKPLIHGREVDWDDVLDHVADGFRDIIHRHGPDAVAFYVSGQLLTEDYYVANKLMKGFIGSANIDTNSRLCMSSSVAGHKRAFGADTVPGCYEDLEQADLIVLTGSNTAWCHPVLFQRIRAAREQNGTRVVVVDPRRTATCEIADLHLALEPDSDIALFNGLARHLVDAGLTDEKFLDAHAQGNESLVEHLADITDPVRFAAERCGLPTMEVARFFDWFGATERTVSVYSQGVNQSRQGTDKVNAIINCHLLTGRIGRPGTGPLSFTGQPNAMGGREVGGLANQLAAHMDFNPADIDRVRRFWNAPNIATQAGQKAVDLFEQVRQGRIRAVWIMATNPVVSMPDAERVRAALAECELVVVSDCVADTDTARLAHVLLPASTWGEKDGTVTNSERRISRQRAFREAPGDSRPDWWMICEVARRLGHGAAFDYGGADEIFREHAALSAFENDGARDFDIGGLAHLDRDRYDALQPVQWPVNDSFPAGRPRFFEDGRFYGKSAKASLLPVATPARAMSTAGELWLNTGRIRDQWHTMTRTGAAPQLGRHIEEPFVEVHPGDARWLGLREQDIAEVSSRGQRVRGRVRVTTAQRPGSVFVPFHWSDATGTGIRVNPLVDSHTDPISGQPGFKRTAVRVTRHEPRWQGVLMAREPVEIPGISYAARIRSSHAWQYLVAGEAAVDSWRTWCDARFGMQGEVLEYSDAARQGFRYARIVGGRLQACLFVDQDNALPDRDWLASLFERENIDAETRRAILGGRAPGNATPEGRTVCACFNVSEGTLREAIRDEAVDCVRAVGERTRAGTNCGSCIPEIKNLIAARAST